MTPDLSSRARIPRQKTGKQGVTRSSSTPYSVLTSKPQPRENTASHWNTPPALMHLWPGAIWFACIRSPHNPQRGRSDVRSQTNTPGPAALNSYWWRLWSTSGSIKSVSRRDAGRDVLVARPGMLRIRRRWWLVAGSHDGVGL